MQRQSLLILGATSTIARACAQRFAQAGFNFYLASRDVAELARIAADLQVHYNILVNYSYLDIEDFNSHAHFFNQVLQTYPQLNGVLSAVGYLNDTVEAATNPVTLKIINTNFTGIVNLLSLAKDYLITQKTGFIIGITSVAGDRGRQSNYIYGAAKAGLSTYLQGLRNALHPFNISVLTVKPGFVDTPMTFGKSGVFLAADPVRVAAKIFNALQQDKDSIYVPWFWRYIMLIIKLIPEFIFKRMRL